MSIAQIYGKVFVDEKGEEFGVLRASDSKTEKGRNILAEDGCGNYFIESDSKVYFWDHETNEEVMLSPTVSDFVNGCRAPSEVNLSEEQVQSAWIDPEFAQSLGIETPEDGKIK